MTELRVKKEGRTAMNLYEQDRHFAHTTTAYCEPGTRTLGTGTQEIFSSTLLVHNTHSMLLPGIMSHPDSSSTPNKSHRIADRTSCRLFLSAN